MEFTQIVSTKIITITAWTKDHMSWALAKCQFILDSNFEQIINLKQWGNLQVLFLWINTGKSQMKKVTNELSDKNRIWKSRVLFSLKMVMQEGNAMTFSLECDNLEMYCI